MSLFQGEAILPFLPDIMDHLMNVLKTSSNLKTKEVAVSVIGAVGKLNTIKILQIFTLSLISVFYNMLKILFVQL